MRNRSRFLGNQATYHIPNVTDDEFSAMSGDDDKPLAQAPIEMPAYYIKQ